MTERKESKRYFKLGMLHAEKGSHPDFCDSIVNPDNGTSYRNGVRQYFRRLKRG